MDKVKKLIESGIAHIEVLDKLDSFYRQAETDNERTNIKKSV